jgi:predicted HD phosphohydrolase
LLAVSSPQFSVDETIEILRRLEKSPHEAEAVNQLQHALQAAQFARDNDCDDEMDTAALLHDIGRAPEVLDHYGPGVHERVGAAFEAHPFFEEAAQLRYWDDCSKDGRAQTDDLQSYVEVLKTVWVSVDDDV